jgi:two-component sensor histidine kinase
MASEISFKRSSGSLFLAALLFIFASANGSPAPIPVLAGQQLSLQPWFTALEDANGSATAASLVHQPNAFSPLAALPKGNSTSVYWLRVSLRTGDLNDPDRIIAFNHLTFVDFYLYVDTTLVTHTVAGAFRPQSELAEGDGRLYSALPLQKSKTYTLLIRVHHTKHYQPVFDFEMLPKRRYFDQLRTKQSIDAALMGAVSIFLVYTLMSWLVSRSRSYLWLLMTIAGFGFYVISNSGYWIDWFSPEHPAAGWLINPHFLYLGLIGVYLLIVDFWRVRTDFPKLYRWMRWVPALIAARSVTAFTIDFFTGNYWLSGIIDRMTHPIMLAMVTALLYVCWPRLDPARRYLAWGLILFSLSGLYLTCYALFDQERSLSSVSLVGNGIVLGIFLLFATGLKEEMRQHELAKQAALEELTRLQQHQNSILEKRVDERTEELRITNKRLQNQKYQLAERNTKIELLINELHHRVKNNLQLLYSLLSLQLPIVRDDTSREILKGNIGKIRAMMLVNEKLFTFEKGRDVTLCEFITELGVHLQKIYDTKEKTHIRQDIPASIRLSDKHTLSFGLILSELFTNTFKHAFRDHPDPCIHVKAVEVNDHLLEFSYADNGVGIPADGSGEKFTMGIPLIKDLTRQMNGQMSISGEAGLSYSFTIPV